MSGGGAVVGGLARTVNGCGPLELLWTWSWNAHRPEKLYRPGAMPEGMTKVPDTLPSDATAAFTEPKFCGGVVLLLSATSIRSLGCPLNRQTPVKETAVPAKPAEGAIERTDSSPFGPGAAAEGPAVEAAMSTATTRTQAASTAPTR
jgi:hypothetical protein